MNSSWGGEGWGGRGGGRGRTAADDLFSDCQYSNGTALYGRCEFRIQVIVEAAAACPDSEHCHLFPSKVDYEGRLCK